MRNDDVMQSNGGELWSDRELAAVLVTQGSVPGLQVIIAPHCHGRAWLVDSCCDTVWLSGQITGGTRTAALFESLAALVATAHRGEVAGIPEQRCRSVEPRFTEHG